MSDRSVSHALRFISGKYQGGEFPLKGSRELIIGRSSDLDMVLVEDMVSRKHAKISTLNEQVVIQDLGSTNGTFVNGEKIKRVRLREGDRILIGTSIIKLIAIEGQAADMAAEVPDFHAASASTTSSSPKRTVSGARSMAGTIDEIPLPDLMQLLSTSKKSGVLEVQTDTDFGRIYMRKGQVYYATINDSFDIKPRKAVLRLLAWESGAFELQPPDDREFLDELKESTEALLMETMRQVDEIRRFEELPEPTAMLSVAKPLEHPLRDLKPAQLDLVQAVLNHGTMKMVIDHTPITDLETYEALVSLLEAKVIVTSN